MTAEATVMNTQAVALAADSAVTITSERGTKVWESANKIFGLPGQHTVGVMMFGGADLLGMPWETIIKLYREQLRAKPFPTLSDYTRDLVRFLSDSRPLFPVEAQDEFFERQVHLCYDSIRQDIEGAIEQELASRGKPLSTKEAELIANEAIKAAQDWIAGRPLLDHVPKTYGRDVARHYRTVIGDIKRAVFQQLPLTSGSSRRLSSLAGELFARDVFSERATGIVVAGFGGEDLFPSLDAFRTDGVVLNRLNYQSEGSNVITRTNTAAVRAFAQGEMVFSFMEGVDQNYQTLIDESTGHIFKTYPQTVLDNIQTLNDKTRNQVKRVFDRVGDAAHRDFLDRLENVRAAYYAYPIVQVVSVLPKDELASMAESLVNLTSFRRKVSMQTETVGGPIDVAVISKGDGFIWIQRKKYFDLDQNPHFLAR